MSINKSVKNCPMTKFFESLTGIKKMLHTYTEVERLLKYYMNSVNAQIHRGEKFYFFCMEQVTVTFYFYLIWHTSQTSSTKPYTVLHVQAANPCIVGWF